MTTFDIHERIYNFVVRVLKLTKFLSRDRVNEVLLEQLVRCVTSIGANDQEADGVSSKKDFIHCYTIVRKEAKETLYWLRLIAQNNPELSNRMSDLLKENEEIIKIVSTIIKNANK